MRYLLLLLISLLLSPAIYAQDNLESDTLYKTQYYSFHNNMWMNLHHFFYEQACNRQQNKLKEDGLTFKNIGDSLRIVNLSTNDKQIFDKGVDFYKKYLIDKDLLFSGSTLKWLQAQPRNQSITDTTLSKGFTETLNELRPFYETHFWEHHQKENNQLLMNYIDLIEKTENKVIGKMEELSGSEWKGIVRVDVTTYGNWAGAYSPADDNIVISSIDPLMHTTLFIEFTFHESSHLIFNRKSPFRMGIFLKSKELMIKPPRSLWHAAMFYLSGLATKDALNDYGKSHELIMKKKKVFDSFYQNEEFKSILNEYYKQNIELEEMATKLLSLN